MIKRFPTTPLTLALFGYLPCHRRLGLLLAVTQHRQILQGPHPARQRCRPGTHRRTALGHTSTRAPQQGATDEDFYRLVPESPENELILLRVKVENHTATRAIVNIDQEAAQLRDFLQGRYFPIDVSQRAEEAGIPESADDRCNVPVIPEDHAACVKFLWNPVYEESQPDGQVQLVERAQELPNGTGLDGWLVFEVPKDTQFRSFRWSSGDTVIIDF